jgi:lysophospholipase L1-like esterase
MQKETAQKLILVTVGLFIGLLAAESFVRWRGATDEDGNFTFQAYTLRPYRLPVENTQEKIDDYLKREENAFIVYDDLLGWAPRPQGQSSDQLVSYNAAGLRSPVEYALEPGPGVFRIALFGDSFTHGDEVAYENTWGYYLQEILTHTGRDVEVLNFAVGGYGMDQAYLRWQELGRHYQPHLVIFGLQMENVARNVNLIRPLYFPPTTLPFSKPRFIQQAGTLQLINTPTIPVAQVPEVMANIGNWEWGEYEYFLDFDNYQNHFWLRSKLIALAIAASTPVEGEVNVQDEDFFEITAEPAQLTQAILQAFSQDVQASGAIFLMVFLPMAADLRILAQDGTLPYHDLFNALETEHNIIVPTSALLQENNRRSPLLLRLHYSPRGNEIVGEAIAQYLLSHQLIPSPRE